MNRITRDNVNDLHVAWTFHTGDTPLSPTGNGAEDQDTPLQIGELRGKLEQGLVACRRDPRWDRCTRCSASRPSPWL
ncbi:hypothetical protein [Caballeronia sp. LZ025]|uniref:hypothetical protein n=1 Tax=Caballeronia sp. LZ025 TaxID=3038562 RepID=UPI003F8CF640